MMDKKKADPDEAEPMEATVLPAREAMSLISPSTGGELLPDPSSVPTEDGATSEDRSESDDSASSQT
jgi:hypothetical protein